MSPTSKPLLLCPPSRSKNSCAFLIQESSWFESLGKEAREQKKNRGGKGGKKEGKEKTAKWQKEKEKKEKKEGGDKKFLQPSHSFSHTYSLSQLLSKNRPTLFLTNHIIGSCVAQGEHVRVDVSCLHSCYS